MDGIKIEKLHRRSMAFMLLDDLLEKESRS